MKFPEGKDPIPLPLSDTRNITFSFHLLVRNSLPSELNYYLISCIEESTAETTQGRLNGLGCCMYIILTVDSAWALSGSHAAARRISELCNNGDFISSLETWCHHPLISSGNGHYRVFGLHNASLADDVCTLEQGLLCRGGWFSVMTWLQMKPKRNMHTSVFE